VLESAAAGSKQVVDALYGSYLPGAAPPAMSNANGNFIDQWEDEVTTDAGYDDADKQAKARHKLWYLIASDCEAVNSKHSAVPTDAAEKAILEPIVESFLDTPAKKSRMLELDIGWEGAQSEGVVYLQRYKQDTDEKNRARCGLFHTCIHEYLHALVHPAYEAYANAFRDKATRRASTR
jgi:hypothetical protein